MTRNPDQPGQGGTAAERRKAQLAAALKANMARRKAQGRARATQATAGPADGQDETPGPNPGGQHETE